MHFRKSPFLGKGTGAMLEVVQFFGQFLVLKTSLLILVKALIIESPEIPQGFNSTLTELQAYSLGA